MTFLDLWHQVGDCKIEHPTRADREKKGNNSLW
jgi:hypothetical protein